MNCNDLTNKIFVIYPYISDYLFTHLFETKIQHFCYLYFIFLLEY